MKFTAEEAKIISRDKIYPIFYDVIREYDCRKYPTNQYKKFRNSFASLNASNTDIHNALIWKWGHWGKPNFPQRHRELINEVTQLWPHFIQSNWTKTSNETFTWWKNKLENRNKNRFITIAYITHLVHYLEPVPIIDQHNFRAMNELKGNKNPKKRPSKWGDILELKNFMELICAELNCDFETLDRFLMMYGRNHVARKASISK